jgi:hypothetical protein
VTTEISGTAMLAVCTQQSTFTPAGFGLKLTSIVVKTSTTGKSLISQSTSTVWLTSTAV